MRKDEEWSLTHYKNGLRKFSCFQSLRQVDTLTCNAVRITYRDGKTALVICQQDGTITLMDDVEAC